MLIEYQLSIRDAADTSDILTVDSTRGGAIQGEPSGDGGGLDPMTGDASIGSYSLRVIDQDMTLITSLLADSSAEPQLMGRRAIIRTREDGGSWVVMVAGFITRLSLVEANLWDVEVGEMFTRPLRAQAHVEATTSFPDVTNIIGTPVTNGFGPIPDYGPTVFQASDVDTDYVEMRYVSGPLGAGGETGGPGPVNNAGEPLNFQRVNRRAIGFSEHTQNHPVSYYHFPGLVARVEGMDGTLLGEITPLSTRRDWITDDPNYAFGQRLITETGSMFLDWTSSQPSNGDYLIIRVYPLEISDRNPLHYKGHVLDYCTKHLTDQGVSYSSTSVGTVKAIIGDVRVEWRFTESPGTIFEAITNQALGPFGFGIRPNSIGEVEFIATRLKLSSLPSVTVTPDDLRDPGNLWSLSDGEAYNKVTWRGYTFREWTGDDRDVGGRVTDSPADGIEMLPETVRVTNGDPASTGDKELVYDLPGSTQGAVDQGWSLVLFVTGIAQEVFDRAGRGLIKYSRNVLRGLGIAQGDTVILDEPWLPNALASQSPTSQRGGQRIVQVVRSTAAPWGQSLALVDRGSAVQNSVVPTLTIAASANDPRKVARVTITNSAALLADGSSVVRVEMAILAAPAGHGKLLGVLDLNAATVIDTPPQAAGSTVLVRARTESLVQRPGLWSGWSSVALTALSPPTSVSFAAVGGDGTALAGSWTLGETDYPLEIRWRVVGDADITYRIKRLPPGSVSFDIDGLTPGEDYEGDVAHVEEYPERGASTRATWSQTTNGTTPTLSVPINPAIWSGVPGPALTAGSPKYEPKGIFGLDVTVEQHPSYCTLEVALETSAGSGTPGTYREVSRVNSAVGGRTRMTASTKAGYDGRLRYCRARLVYPGWNSSVYTSALSVDPWSTTPVPPPLVAGGEMYVPADRLVNVGIPSSAQAKILTIQVPQGAFTPLRSTDSWDRTGVGGYYHPGVTGTSELASSMIPNMLATDRVIRIRARLWKNAAGDTAQVALEGQRDDGTINPRGNATLSTTGAYTTVTTSLGASSFVVGTEPLRFTAVFTASSAITDARLVWAEIEFERAEYD